MTKNIIHRLLLPIKKSLLIISQNSIQFPTIAIISVITYICIVIICQYSLIAFYRSYSGLNYTFMEVGKKKTLPTLVKTYAEGQNFILNPTSKKSIMCEKAALIQMSQTPWSMPSCTSTFSPTPF